MKKGDVLAVYGTLRRGHGANSYFDNRATYLGKSRISGKLFHLGGFPGVKRVGAGKFISEGPTVVVDLYQIDNEDLPGALDRYEGYPYLYDRHLVEEERGKKVWVYEINREPGEDRLIVSGDWERLNEDVKTTAE